MIFLSIVSLASGCFDGSMTIGEAIEQTCGLKLLDPFDIVSREKHAPFSIQGIGYWENTEVNLQDGDIARLLSHLNKNNLYLRSVDAHGLILFEYTEVAKFSKICRLDPYQNILSYSLTYQ